MSESVPCGKTTNCMGLNVEPRGANATVALLEFVVRAQIGMKVTELI